MRRMLADETEPSMNRVFTTREKILLVILAILLIGCFYYLVVLKPSLDTLASDESQLSTMQAVALQQVVATKKAELEQQIKEAEANGVDQKTLPDFDNTKSELAELDAILAEANSYNIDFWNMRSLPARSYDAM